MEQLLSVSSIPIVSFREIQHSMKLLSFFVHYAKGLCCSFRAGALRAFFYASIAARVWLS